MKKKEMLINCLQPEETRIAILEDGVLEELYVERHSNEGIVGNVYRGKIVNIEPGIQAAFVDFGVGRNGFLHVSDIDPIYFEGGKGLDKLVAGCEGVTPGRPPRGERRPDDREDDRSDRPRRDDRTPRGRTEAHPRSFRDDEPSDERFEERGPRARPDRGADRADGRYAERDEGRGRRGDRGGRVREEEAPRDEERDSRRRDSDDADLDVSERGSGDRGRFASRDRGRREAPRNLDRDDRGRDDRARDDRDDRPARTREERRDPPRFDEERPARAAGVLRRPRGSEHLDRPGLDRDEADRGPVERPVEPARGLSRRDRDEVPPAAPRDSNPDASDDGKREDKRQRRARRRRGRGQDEVPVAEPELRPEAAPVRSGDEHLPDIDELGPEHLEDLRREIEARDAELAERWARERDREPRADSAPLTAEVRESFVNDDEEEGFGSGLIEGDDGEPGTPDEDHWPMLEDAEEEPAPGAAAADDSDPDPLRGFHDDEPPPAWQRGVNRRTDEDDDGFGDGLLEGPPFAEPARGAADDIDEAAPPSAHDDDETFAGDPEHGGRDEGDSDLEDADGDGSAGDGEDGEGDRKKRRRRRRRRRRGGPRSEEGDEIAGADGATASDSDVEPDLSFGHEEDGDFATPMIPDADPAPRRPARAEHAAAEPREPRSDRRGRDHRGDRDGAPRRDGRGDSRREGRSFDGGRSGRPPVERAAEPERAEEPLGFGDADDAAEPVRPVRPEPRDARPARPPRDDFRGRDDDRRDERRDGGRDRAEPRRDGGRNDRPGDRVERSGPGERGRVEERGSDLDRGRGGDRGRRPDDDRPRGGRGRVGRDRDDEPRDSDRDADRDRGGRGEGRRPAPARGAAEPVGEREPRDSTARRPVHGLLRHDEADFDEFEDDDARTPVRADAGRDDDEDDRDDGDGDGDGEDRGGRGRRGGGRGRPFGQRNYVDPRRPRHRPPIQAVFKRGQEVLVQVIKEGLDKKGPTLSTYISIPGRYLVLMPGFDKVGVSRKIVDPDVRRDLRRTLLDLDRPAGCGFIVRTAGSERTKADLESDLGYLSRLWDSVMKRLKDQKGPGSVYHDDDMIIRTIRDIFTGEIDTIWIDERQAYERAREFLRAVMPKYVDRLKFFEGPRPIFHQFKIEREIEQIQKRRVELSNGGSLVIDQAEALVAIDVNSGSFRAAEQDAEENAFRMNMAAAREIARQLRLRDLGGVIVIDFIDMRDERHRRAVEEELRNAVRRDRARTKVLRMSAFCMVEMTRQRIRPSLRRSMYRECPTCAGTGQVKTAESLVIDVMRLLTYIGQIPNIDRVDVRVETEVATFLLNHKRKELALIEERNRVSIGIRGVPGAHPELLEMDCLDERGNPVAVDALQRASAERTGRRR